MIIIHFHSKRLLNACIPGIFLSAEQVEEEENGTIAFIPPVLPDPPLHRSLRRDLVRVGVIITT